MFLVRVQIQSRYSVHLKKMKMVSKIYNCHCKWVQIIANGLHLFGSTETKVIPQISYKTILVIQSCANVSNEIQSEMLAALVWYATEELRTDTGKDNRCYVKKCKK